MNILIGRIFQFNFEFESKRIKQFVRDELCRCFGIVVYVFNVG